MSTPAPSPADLPRLYSALVAATPRGYVPYVTLTQDPARPYGTVIANSDGSLMLTLKGKTIEGLATLARYHLPEGQGEPTR